jgi:hypothetical protein
VKIVNRKILIIAMIVMAAVMLAASINMAFATTTYYDYMSAGGSVVVDVPGQTPVLVYLWHGVGSYYSGTADRIMLVVLSTGLVAGYENNPARHAFSASIGTGYPEFLVKPWQIGIFRIGKTSVAYWTVPLVVPASDGHPAVTIPPGVLVLQGQGDLLYESVPTTPIGTLGWSYAVDYYYWDATVTLFCPGWHFFGSVGAATTWGPFGLAPQSFKFQAWTWTGP